VPHTSIHLKNYSNLKKAKKVESPENQGRSSLYSQKNVWKRNDSYGLQGKRKNKIMMNI
jgi:hypothetical protein